MLKLASAGTPSQFYVGGLWEVPTGIERVWFRPNAEVGVGHDETTAGINFEFVYRQPLARTDWRLFFGGGPAFNLTSAHSNTNAAGGLNLLIGISHAGGLFTQLKVGLVDGPGIRFGVGYTF